MCGFLVSGFTVRPIHAVGDGKFRGPTRADWVFIRGGCSRRGVRWMGVVLYNPTSIFHHINHYTLFPLHPPLLNLDRLSSLRGESSAVQGEDPEFPDPEILTARNPTIYIYLSIYLSIYIYLYIYIHMYIYIYIEREREI